MKDYWTKTGELFGKIIQKPKMKEQLLKKPPPKYIYDIVMNTMKVTGFPKGLFTDEEQDVKFFEAQAKNKIQVLKKVIDISKIVTNENFDIKVTSILKGEEPDKTNYFLQCFYKAATNGKDNSKFISKYLDHQSKKNSKDEDKKQESKKGEEKQTKEKPKEMNQQTNQNQSSQKKGAPKGIISEKGDNFDEESNNNIGKEEISLKKGTGMKLDKHIFVHEDLINDEKNSQNKTKISNVNLEVIKSHVQEITKTTNPIGKFIEFIGEDIDNMNKELQSWIKESKSYKDRYDEEIKKSDETLLPLQNELLELEDSIRDEQMQIKSIKSRLIKNEKIIQNLITNVISFKNDQGN